MFRKSYIRIKCRTIKYWPKNIIYFWTAKSFPEYHCSVSYSILYRFAYNIIKKYFFINILKDLSTKRGTMKKERKHYFYNDSPHLCEPLFMQKNGKIWNLSQVSTNTYKQEYGSTLELPVTCLGRISIYLIVCDYKILFLRSVVFIFEAINISRPYLFLCQIV